ncbi:hypothetical protein XENOCAPTIV_023824 [Xenoophorus captivus]|uniref:Uncharacterized protein n=1 Tax=Xenoophorus captivus TaxID=1517983 RepID=A0ABV0R629_9TELE
MHKVFLKFSGANSAAAIKDKLIHFFLHIFTNGGQLNCPCLYILLLQEEIGGSSQKNHINDLNAKLQTETENGMVLYFYFFVVYLLILKKNCVGISRSPLALVLK